MEPHALPATSRTVSRRTGLLVTVFMGVLIVYILEYATFLIRSNTADKIIKLVLAVVLIAGFKYRSIDRNMRKTLWLYAALFAAAALASTLQFDVIGYVQLFKIILQFFVFPAIIFRFAAIPVPGRLLSWQIPLAVLFSVQAVITVGLVYSGIELPQTTVYIGRLSDLREVDLGLLGYGNTYTHFGTGLATIRAQSWFLEPSLLASFLLYPIFMSWAFYRASGKLRYLLAMFICIGGLLATFSLAGYIAAAAAVASIALIRPVKTRGFKSAFLRFAGPVLIVVAFLFMARYLLNKTFQIREERDADTFSAKVIGRERDNPVQRLMRSDWQVEQSIALVKQNPFGVGLSNTLGEEQNSANALIHWLFAAGIPGLIILALLYWHLVYVYVMPCLLSRSPIARAAAASFIAVTVQGLSYGTWSNAAYMYVVAVLVLCGSHPQIAALHPAPAKAKV
jgi:hypothetical protein